MTHRATEDETPVTDTVDVSATDPEQDPDVGPWLIRVLPDRDPDTVSGARAYTREINAQALAQLDPSLAVASIVDAEVPAGDGHPAVPVRVLRPATEPGGSEPVTEPLPLVVYFHGGGWVVGDLDTHLGHAQRLASQIRAVVVSVGYRLAPEHRFPAAFDDALRATAWADEHAAELGGDGRLVVAGDSAGAQLAASVAIARRDAGLRVDAQLLQNPVTDVAGRYQDEDINQGYMSRWSRHKRFGLTLEGMVNFACTYVDEADSTDWRVSPKRAASLAGVAPAVIHTSTLDVLRTEGNFYADDLRNAGVRVIAREHPSLNHSYFGMGGNIAVAEAAGAQAAEDLRTLLDG